VLFHSELAHAVDDIHQDQGEEPCQEEMLFEVTYAIIVANHACML
jgi:hypothetical protein